MFWPIVTSLALVAALVALVWAWASSVKSEVYAARLLDDLHNQQERLLLQEAKSNVLAVEVAKLNALAAELETRLTDIGKWTLRTTKRL